RRRQVPQCLRRHRAHTRASGTRRVVLARYARNRRCGRFVSNPAGSVVTDATLPVTRKDSSVRSNLVAIVCMGMAALVGVGGYLLTDGWNLPVLGLLCLAGCIALLYVRRQMAAERISRHGPAG